MLGVRQIVVADQNDSFVEMRAWIVRIFFKEPLRCGFLDVGVFLWQLLWRDELGRRGPRMIFERNRDAGCEGSRESQRNDGNRDPAKARP